MFSRVSAFRSLLPRLSTRGLVAPAGINSQLPADPNPIAGWDILSAEQFDRSKIEYLINASREMRHAVRRYGGLDICNRKILVNAFFEPSTRTACSFHAAMLRLGGQVVPISSTTSSFQKGETLQDTVRVLQSYGDVLVMRHPENGAAKFAADFTRMPVINAGDGSGEHPTQGLLDILCMAEEHGKLDGLQVAMVGDLKYGRTVHSLSQMLSHFNVKMHFISPESLRMPDYVLEKLNKRGAHYEQHKDFSKVMKDLDVFYITRVQKERFANIEDYNAVKGSYVIDSNFLKNAKRDASVLHPLPRVDEITPDVDDDSRACYFREPEYGLYMRMALLAGVLGRL